MFHQTLLYSPTNTTKFSKITTVCDQNITVFSPNYHCICPKYHCICPKYHCLCHKYHCICSKDHCICSKYHCICSKYHYLPKYCCIGDNRPLYFKIFVGNVNLELSVVMSSHTVERGHLHRLFPSVNSDTAKCTSPRKLGSVYLPVSLLTIG